MSNCETPMWTSLGELLARPHQDGDWGPWELDPTDPVLIYNDPNNHYEYWIDLRTCTSSAAVLDWICQIIGKNWGDNATLAGLVRAFDDVLHPQAHLCSMGQSTTLTPVEISNLVSQRGDL